LTGGAFKKRGREGGEGQKKKKGGEKRKVPKEREKSESLRKQAHQVKKKKKDQKDPTTEGWVRRSPRGLALKFPGDRKK